MLDRDTLSKDEKDDDDGAASMLLLMCIVEYNLIVICDMCVKITKKLTQQQQQFPTLNILSPFFIINLATIPLYERYHSVPDM